MHAASIDAANQNTHSIYQRKSISDCFVDMQVPVVTGIPFILHLQTQISLLADHGINREIL